jgi:hypothetical protein
MAHLTRAEFTRAVELLGDELGLQRLRDRFVRLNALVMRRRVASAAGLADQLYLLSGGLRRQVPATAAFHGIWAEQINPKLGEEGEKALEALAGAINECLGEGDQIVEEKAAQLDEHLRRYEQRLAEVVGAERARLDMLLKAVPAVAAKLRALPSPAAEPAVAAPS